MISLAAEGGRGIVRRGSWGTSAKCDSGGGVPQSNTVQPRPPAARRDPGSPNRLRARAGIGMRCYTLDGLGIGGFSLRGRGEMGFCRRDSASRLLASCLPPSFDSRRDRERGKRRDRGERTTRFASVWGQGIGFFCFFAWFLTLGGSTYNQLEELNLKWEPRPNERFRWAASPTCKGPACEDKESRRPLGCRVPSTTDPTPVRLSTCRKGGQFQRRTSRPH